MRRFRLAAAALAATFPLAAQQTSAPRPVHITVDFAAPKMPYDPIFSWFGYDEGNYTTTLQGRALLRELHDLSPVPVYIRAHHLLTSGDGTPELKWSSTGVYREDAGGKPLYDFHILDGIFDAYKAAGVRPMVELGFMPQDLAAVVPGKDVPYQVHFPGNTTAGASNNPPKDYAKWRELVRVVTAHLVERYGADTVRQWPFEVWNEPDISYWHGTPEDYWRLYDFAVDGVRAALPCAEVGGPATTSPRNAKGAAFLDDFLTHVETGTSAATGGPVPLDFISFHAKGQPRIDAGTVTMGLREELRDADRGFAIVAGHPKLRDLPIILSEADPEGCAACSSKQNPANNYRNGTLYPAYTAAAYKGLLELAAKYHVYLLSMLSWSFEFEGHESFEGFRSLATNGVDKPVLNVFRMLGKMEGERVPVTSSGAVPLTALLQDGVSEGNDVDGFATARQQDASLLVWNYADQAATTEAAHLLMTLQGLPAGVYTVMVQQFRIDKDHSNAYTLWQAMGAPPHPTAAQTRALESHAGLESFAAPVSLPVMDGRLDLEADLPPQSLALFEVQWTPKGHAVR